MKCRKFGLVLVLVVGMFGFGGGCDDLKEMCGPCGEVGLGDSTISGDARLDGFFKAVGTLGSATATIQGDFRAQLEELAAVFGVTGTADMDITALVAAVKGSIEAEISANVQGSLRVKFEPPKCSANVNVSVDAQASCEAKAGCEVDAECSGGEVSVSCEGTCSGGCSGNCSGSCSAKVDAACSGVCKGQCELDVAASCSGTCNGTCDGNCTLQDNAGNCKGECDGNCDGSCEVEGGASCSGTCHGECAVEATATCEGTCEGSCDAECSGGCEGTATPPSCSVDADCEATADCQASASAQASASMECTPPSIAVDFDFAAGVDATAQAEFIAKMETLRVKMMGIVQGMFKLRALVDADYAASIGIESPVAVIGGQLEGFVSGGIDGFDVAPGLIPCVIPAFEDAIEIMGSVATDTVATVQGEFEIVGVLNIL